MTNVNLFDPAVKRDPYPTYEELRGEGPVALHDSVPMAVITGFEEATTVLSDPTTFSSAAGRPGPDLFGADVMLFADPPDHSRLRGPVSKALSPRAIAGLAPSIERLSDELVNGFGPGASWDAVANLGTELPVVVIADLLGIPRNDRDRFKKWSDDLISADIMDPEATARAIEGASQLREYMAEVVRERRQHRGDDLVSRFVAANEDRSINEAELLAACVLLLVAGNETTTNLISNAVFALATRPALQASLRADPTGVAAFVDEILRWDPPVQATARFTLAPTTIGARELQAGQMVMVLLAAANRDPRRFAEPDVLRPDRLDGGHLAFGHGIHYCIGVALARLEANAAIAALLRSDPTGWEMAIDPGTLEYGSSFFLRGLTSLMIRRPAG